MFQRLVHATYFQAAVTTLGQDVGNHGVIAGFTINDEDFYAVLLFWWYFCEAGRSFVPVRAGDSGRWNITYSSSQRGENAASDILNST
jgi:hypothetical protein